MINIHNYRPHADVTREMLQKNNFKYIDGIYLCRFPVYKHQKDIVLWCILFLDIENNSCNIQITDTNNATYAPYFNRTYSVNNIVVESIDKKLQGVIGTLVKKKILKKRGRKK